jgi:hypothetical protein
MAEQTYHRGKRIAAFDCRVSESRQSGVALMVLAASLWLSADGFHS